MELLSEMSTTQQALNYAVNRERGQANQQDILGQIIQTKVQFPTFDKINHERQHPTHNKNPHPTGNVEAHSQWPKYRNAPQKPCNAKFEKVRTLYIAVYNKIARMTSYPCNTKQATINKKSQKHRTRNVRKRSNRQNFRRRVRTVY